MQADKNQAALDAAMQRQASLEQEIKEIEQRANRSGPLVDAVGQSRPEQRWGRLQSHSFQGGSQDLDEQDDTADVDTQQSQVDAAVATANAVVEALKKGGGKPALPVKERGAPGTLSDKEFLNRFKRKSAPKPPKEDQSLPESCRGGSSSSTCVPAAGAPPAKQHKGEHKKSVKVKQEAVKVKQELVKVKEEPRSPKQRRRTPADSGEQAPAEDDEPSGELPRPLLDVNTLVPKRAQAHCQWKGANPSEWRALMSQGEIVSPHKNLLKAKPIGSSKRKSEGSQSVDGPQKTRRGDDSNEQAYQRRQDIWERGAGASSVALKPKQQVDEEGKPLCKQEPGDRLQVKEEPASADIRDDVHIAEGLRSPRWLWEALYPYQHQCVKWLWGLHGEKMGGILADEMGLGKTVQIAAYLAVLHHSGVLQRMRVQNHSLGAASPPKPGGVLIVSPATLISQWKSELNLWYPPLRVYIMHQVSERERKEAIENATSKQGVLITSYETLRIANEALMEATWVMMVLDEGQKIRNPHANLTIATKRFSTPHRIILSGSPIQNKLEELWSLFDFICPGRLGTLPVFIEEFAHPIEKGNLVGSSEAQVATAYQCAMALRELTEPCILRRTKAECMDVLRLPTKQEQVLFCNLTPEQYQVYVEFLETDQVRRAKSASSDRKALGAVFFSISVLRKLCNHPDLLLQNLPEEEQPDDMWHFEKSGKMKVLSEIMKLWHRERHRALIFVQTIQMLEVLQRWMRRIGYTHLRIDGKTPVKRRLKLIDEFNANKDLFAMILTTRVGGVGLNIVGADRVLIFDPDWNPMTDVQARERAWRIGQKKEVAVYRLVLTGTVEEKIYQRQVYKHFLSQKVLQDPRQRQFFKWNDLADLFEVPPPPPNLTKSQLLLLKDKYKAAFRKMSKLGDLGDHEVETTDIMKAITDLPMKEQHTSSKATSDETNSMLQTLYDTNGIKASFNHDKVEQTLLDRKIVRQGAEMIAQRALDALKRSGRERAGHPINEPTWTGKQGRAGMRTGSSKQEAKVAIKKEPGTLTFGYGSTVSRPAAVASTAPSRSSGGGVSSADILQGLRQLAAIRSMAADRSGSQAVAAMPDIPAAAAEANCVGTPLELLDSDRKLAEDILRAFLDKKIAGTGHSLTSGQVLEVLAVNVAAHHNDLFKTLLKQMCVLHKAAHPKEPGYWTLREEFWPRRLKSEP
eukprot:TRINITY_DN25134_c0_g2_i1.p1 TRINITY_DN25134_c0_g2~~TRINITY_DN25134_c0_g2_i1.p1  ORF type:complete len:1346 (-),score=317.31 TRINITY_DN25134_c0_g2_i1:85-3675(-)